MVNNQSINPVWLEQLVDKHRPIQLRQDGLTEEQCSNLSNDDMEIYNE